MSCLEVVVGGQYGSESKGRVAAALAARRRRQGRAVIGVRVAGPNAGHVVIGPEGQRYALRQLPVSLVSDPMSMAVIAAGSEIDPEVLREEIATLERDGCHVRHRLLIDREATILDPVHRDREGGNDGPMQTRIGSTGKGIGAARADRIMRTARRVADVHRFDDLVGGGTVIDTQYMLRDTLRHDTDRAVIIEGTQGYGLGLHAGHYPFATSSDCRAIDFLAMAGVSPWQPGIERFRIWVVLRAYPIRVAGNSGPLPGETSWEALGLPEEHTTVTKKVRRVGAWDPNLARMAVEANGGHNIPGSIVGPVRVALAMADQQMPEVAGADRWGALSTAHRQLLSDWIDQLERETGAPVESIGTGPDSTIWLESEQPAGSVEHANRAIRAGLRAPIELRAGVTE